MRQPNDNPVPKARIDRAWWVFTQSGNEAVQRGHLHDAKRFYQRALDESNALFDKAWGDSSACLYAPMTYNITVVNLATLFQRLGQETTSRRHAGLALERLTEIAVESEAPERLRLQCLRHLPRAIAVLEQFCPDAAHQACFKELIARAQTLQAQFEDDNVVAEPGLAPDADKSLH